MAELFDFRPRRLYNVQSYICVESLVYLGVYKKAGIVRRPAQQVGWQLKKWENWENQLREIEKMRIRIYKLEHNLSETVENMVEIYQFFEDKPHEIAERVRAELNQVLQDKPENPSQPRFLRRLNWVEHKRDAKELISRTSKMNDKFEAIKQAQDNIFSIVRRRMLDQGKSTANVSSTDDKKNEEENLPC